MERTIRPEDLAELLNDAMPVIIDVQRETDHDADPYMIPNARWRDPEKVAEWSGDLPRDREVIIYCVRGGSVSNGVLDHLRGKGIRARYIEGGITAWKESGTRVAAAPQAS